MKAFYNFVQHHFAAYIACCCAVGLAIRLCMAGGDLGLFFSPFFPLFR